jgi:ComF family protein
MKIASHIKTSFENIINLFFSSTCAGCNGELSYGQKHLCVSCLIHFPINQTLNPSELFWGRVPVKNGISLLTFEKGNSTQKLLHKIKYKDQKQLAIHLGSKMGRAINSLEWASQIDLIIPVPLHPSKERSRGYNQALLLAEGIKEVLSVPIENNAIIRTKANVTQTKKNKYERWDNVEQVFKLAQSKHVKNKHVLIVDDAITTGATLESCIRCFLEVENCQVSIATLAIAK